MRVRARHDFRQLVTDGLEHAGLEAGAEYFVIEVNNEYVRIVDRKGEPILYPKTLFEVLDRSVPQGWQFREYEDGEYFLHPVQLSSSKFYDDWFGSDGDATAEAAARERLRAELVRAGEATSDAADRRVIDEALARLLPAGTRPIRR